MLDPERDTRALRLIEEWCRKRRSFGAKEDIAKIENELMDLFPGRPASITNREVELLTVERDQREARRRMLDMALDTLSYIPTDQVVVENNPLHLGGIHGESYLEQVQVLMPEVGPGEGEHIRNAIVMVIDVANHRLRDELSDTERLRIGWEVPA